MSMEDLQAKYDAAMHGMQAGVRIISNDPSENECTPVHLRVGVNSALSDIGALAALLIAKGVFTDEEYMTAVVEFAQREHAAYETRCSAKLGTKVTLV